MVEIPRVEILQDLKVGFAFLAFLYHRLGFQQEIVEQDNYSVFILLFLERPNYHFALPHVLARGLGEVLLPRTLFLSVGEWVGGWMAERTSTLPKSLD